MEENKTQRNTGSISKRRMARIERDLRARFGDAVNVQAEDGVLRLSGRLSTHADAVTAGLIAADRKSRYHVVSDLTAADGTVEPPMRLPDIRDDALEGVSCDVLIIGGGVVGCAIARELSRYRMQVLLVEKEYDVALHASSRNDGMIHPGIDIRPGLLKKRLNNRGNRMYDKLCGELGVEFSRNGQYLCFENPWYLPVLYLSKPYWRLTGAGGTKVCTRRELKRREPDVSDQVRCALFFERTGEVCPYNLTIALMENAVQNGVRLSLDTAVTGMTVENGRIVRVSTNRGTVTPRLVINAAGVFSEEVAKMAGDRFFSIHPRKGTNAILDKKARKYVSTAYSLMGTQSKSGHTKGGGVVGTVDGNVLIGPDAHETAERENFATDAASIAASFDKHHRVAPWLTQRDIITYFTGVRAATYEEDFIVESGHATANLLHAAGIQSPGLTAAPAIAERIAGFAARFFQGDPAAEPDPAFDPIRPPIVKASELPDAERAALIARDPDYGEIVCRCEQVSRGEILAALRRNVPCRTVDGVKRRVRPGMGRCQGGFCGPLVLRIIAEEFHTAPEDVRRGYPGSELLLGQKGGAQ